MGAGPRAAHQQVAPELEDQGLQGRVALAGSNPRQALVGREGRTLTEVEAHPVEQCAVVVHVTLDQLRSGALARDGQLGLGERGVAAPEAGARGEDEDELRPARGMQAVPVGTRPHAVARGLEQREVGRPHEAVLERGGSLGGLTLEAQLPRGRRGHRRAGHSLLRRPREACVDLELVRLRGGQAHDEGLIDGTREHLACEAAGAHAPLDACDPGLQVEGPRVVLEVAVGHHLLELQVAQGLVAAGHRARRERGHREGIGLGRLARQQQGPHLLQLLGGPLVEPRLRRSRPEGVLVELQVLPLRVAVHHGAEAAIADRQGLEPLCGRLAVPEHVPTRRALLPRGQPPERPIHPDLEAVASARVVVLEAERVGAGREVDGAVLAQHAVRAAVLDDELAVHVQPRPVVADGVEPVLARTLDREVALEHQREVVHAGPERDRDVVRRAGRLRLDRGEVGEIGPVPLVGLPADGPGEGEVPRSSGAEDGEGGQEGEQRAHRECEPSAPARHRRGAAGVGGRATIPACWA